MRISELARQTADALAETLWPTRCVGCDQPGELLCEECRAGLPWIEQHLACPSCGAPYGFLTCTECDGSWLPRATVAALGFHGAPARMVTCLKDAHELRLAPVIAAAMACSLEEASAWPARDGAPRFSPSPPREPRLMHERMVLLAWREEREGRTFLRRRGPHAATSPTARS